MLNVDILECYFAGYDTNIFFNMLLLDNLCHLHDYDVFVWFNMKDYSKNILELCHLFRVITFNTIIHVQYELSPV